MPRLALHRHRSVERIARILRRCRRRSEKSHQAIAEVLIERSAVSKDDIGHRGKVFVEKSNDLFRWGVLRNSGEAANVGKQHRYSLVDTAELE